MLAVRDISQSPWATPRGKASIMLLILHDSPCNPREWLGLAERLLFGRITASLISGNANSCYKAGVLIT